jgi:hypothetical protein
VCVCVCVRVCIPCACQCWCVCAVYVYVCVRVCIYTYIGSRDDSQVVREPAEGESGGHSFKNVLFACKIYNKSSLLKMKHLGGKFEPSMV